MITWDAEMVVDVGCGGRAWEEQRARERIGGGMDWSNRERLDWVVVSMAVGMWGNGREEQGVSEWVVN